jgi:hypothetical protein
MVRAHGNWCGPNWTAGQKKPAKELSKTDKDVPAIDALDQACKNHDIGIAENDPEANERFYEEAPKAGGLGTVARLAVMAAGPPSHSYLRSQKNMRRQSVKKVRSRDAVREAIEAAQANRRSERVASLRSGARAMDEEEESLTQIIADADEVLAESEQTPETETSSQPNLTATRHPRLKAARETRAARQLNMDGSGDNEPMAVRGSEEPAGVGMMMQKVQPIYRQPEFNVFTETRTVRCPVTFYLSMNRLNHAVPVSLKLRLNMPYDIMKDNTLQVQTVNQPRAQGLSNDYALRRHNNSQENGSYLIPFPTTVVGDTAAIVAATSSHGTVSPDRLYPANRNFYFRNWQAWTPLSTDYRITILNAAESIDDLQHCKLFTTMEQYTANNGFDDQVPTAQPLSDVLNYPFMTQHTVDPRNVNTSTSDYVLISGTWTPTSIPKRNVFNDQDIKIWNKTGGAVGPIPEMDPLVQEQLTILAYKHELFPVAPRTDQELETARFDQSGAPVTKQFDRWPQGATNINLRIDLSYVVQVRDLPRYLRYVNANTADSALFYMNDLKQMPRIREFIGTGNPSNV